MTCANCTDPSDVRAPLWTDILVDVCFIFDVGINFRTAYYNAEGDLEMDARDIARHYAHGWLAADLIASVPFDWFMDTGGTNRISKIPRLLRIGRLVKRLDNFLDARMMRPLYGLLGFLLFTHSARLRRPLFSLLSRATRAPHTRAPHTHTPHTHTHTHASTHTHTNTWLAQAHTRTRTHGSYSSSRARKLPSRRRHTRPALARGRALAAPGLLRAPRGMPRVCFQRPVTPLDDVYQRCQRGDTRHRPNLS